MWGLQVARLRDAHLDQLQLLRQRLGLDPVPEDRFSQIIGSSDRVMLGVVRQQQQIDGVTTLQIVRGLSGTKVWLTDTLLLDGWNSVAAGLIVGEAMQQARQAGASQVGFLGEVTAPGFTRDHERCFRWLQRTGPGFRLTQAQAGGFPSVNLVGPHMTVGVTGTELVQALNPLMRAGHDSFVRTLSLKALARVVRSTDRQVYLLTVNGQVVGAGLLAFQLQMDGCCCHLTDIWLDRVWEGRGLREALVTHLVQTALDQGVDSVVATGVIRNSRLEACLADLGFNPWNIRSCHRQVATPA